MTSLPACTIASNNYLGMASVLAASYQEHHPGADVYVCVADRPAPEIDYTSLPFVVIFAEELEIPKFENFAFRYDILELNTAVKPFLLTHLRDRFGLAGILYFDPDILIFDTLSGIGSALDGHALALTPHITAPLDNRFNPSERKILMLGVYNLGFLGLRFDARTVEFLEWWKERLYELCVVDPEHGLFVDQVWMDFAPAFLDEVAVLRDPIYNIAYWNLPHRRVEQAASGRWTVSGRPVGFFHFSGVRFDDLDVLSRHQNRLAASERPELRPLFELYRDRAFAAGHGIFQDLEYGFGCFEPGHVPIPPLARRVVQRLDPHGRRWPNPFDLAAPDSFFSWLAEPVELAGGSLSRIALALWEERSDLGREFREVWGSDLPAFAAWLRRQDEVQLPPHFLAGVRVAEAAAERPAPLLPFGDNPGEAARALFASLDLANPGGMASWLNEPVPGARHPRPLVTRLMMLLHQMRSDLQHIFPDPLGTSQERFAYWFCSDGRVEFQLGREWIDPVRRSLPWRARLGLAWKPTRRSSAPQTAADGARLPETPPADILEPPPVRPRLTAACGVNLVAALSPSSSTGQLGAGLRAACEHAGIATAVVPLDLAPHDLVRRARFHPPEGIPFPVTLLATEPARTTETLRRLPQSAMPGTLKIGYWLWDLAHLPLELAGEMAHLDEIWVPSRFGVESIRSLAQVAVRWVPPCWPPGATDPAGSGPEKKSTETFTLLTVCEWASPAASFEVASAIEVVRKLRGRAARPVALEIHLRGPSPQQIDELLRLARGLPVTIHTEATRLETLWATADAWLSLHRARALDLGALRAFRLGKPVVATAYGGVTDVLDEGTGFPVEFRLTRLGQSVGPYPRGAVWAEPDLDAAAAQIERLLGEPDEASRRAEQARHEAEALYGMDAASTRFHRELDRAVRGQSDP